MTVTQSLLVIVVLVAIGGIYNGTNYSHSFQRILGEVEETVERALYGGGYRIAVFGESDSWGADLEPRFDAYVYHLSSPKVSNYAFYNAGPNYASVCTQSIVGDDEIFDVILLEHYLRAPEGLVGLATRLRNRFPTTLIIFVKLWKPYMVYRRNDLDSVTNGETLEQWMQRMNIPKGGDASLYSTELYSKLVEDTGDWHVPVSQEAEDALEEAIEAVKGHVVELPISENIKETMAAHLSFFDPYYGHLTREGHHYVSNKVNAIISETIFPEATIGDWGDGDSCHLWFDNGACSFERSENLKMIEHNEMEGNFVLEVPLEGGWIKVSNPFDDARRLFLSYITSDRHSYPRTEVSVHGEEAHILDPGTFVDPLKVHPIKTTSYGSVFLGPGEHTIKLTPQEVTTSSFSLVGASFTDEVNLPDERYFSPLMRMID